jgi:hypothetical protein
MNQPVPHSEKEVCATASIVPGVRQYCVSSALPASIGDRSGRSNYFPANLFDGDLSTAWASSREPGQSCWVLIEFDTEREFDRILIGNGYQKNDGTFRDNYRVRRLKLLTSTGDSTSVTLPDRKGTEAIGLDHRLHGVWVQLIVDDVYPGARDPDVTLSELRVVFAPSVHGQ